MNKKVAEQDRQEFFKLLACSTASAQPQSQSPNPPLATSTPSLLAKDRRRNTAIEFRLREAKSSTPECLFPAFAVMFTNGASIGGFRNRSTVYLPHPTYLFMYYWV